MAPIRGRRGTGQPHQVRPVARPGLRFLRSAVVVVGRRPRRVLVVDLGLVRRPRPPPDGAGDRRRHHARCPVVPGNRAQLRRAGSALGRRPPGSGLPLRGRPVVHDHPPRTAAAGGGRRPGPAGPRGRAGRPGGGLRAQHPRDADRLPRHRRPRRGVVVVLARLRGQGGARPFPPDRAQGPVRRRRLPVPGNGARPEGGSGGDRRQPGRAGRGRDHPRPRLRVLPGNDLRRPLPCPAPP